MEVDGGFKESSGPVKVVGMCGWLMVPSFALSANKNLHILGPMNANQDCSVTQQQINQCHEELTGSTPELGGADANLDDWWTSEWWDAAMSLANDWFPTANEPPKDDSLPTDLDGLVLLCKRKGFASRESIHAFFFGLPEEEWFLKMVDSSRKHPHFQGFVDNTNAYYEMSGEWIFGDEQKGDAIEDLADFCTYLICGPLELAPSRKAEEPLASQVLTTAGKKVYSDIWEEPRLICWSIYFILVYVATSP